MLISADEDVELWSEVMLGVFVGDGVFACCPLYISICLRGLLVVTEVHVEPLKMSILVNYVLD